MRFTLLFVLALTTFVSTGAEAQLPDGARYLSVTEIRDTVADASRAPGGSPGTLIHDQGTYRFFGVRRDQSGEAELHATLDDVFIVQEGTGTLIYGGRLVGARETAPGELRGGEIRNGVTQTLAEGDMVVIPAGTPHHVQITPGGSITYLVLKVPQPATTP